MDVANVDPAGHNRAGQCKISTPVSATSRLNDTPRAKCAPAWPALPLTRLAASPARHAYELVGSKFAYGKLLSGPRAFNWDECGRQRAISQQKRSFSIVYKRDVMSFAACGPQKRGCCLLGLQTSSLCIGNQKGGSICEIMLASKWPTTRVKVVMFNCYIWSYSFEPMLT